MPIFQEERTEPATPKRKEEARKKGNVAKTRELPSAMLILTMGIVLYFCGSNLSTSMMGYFRYYWSDFSTPITISSMSNLSICIIQQIITLTAPLFIALILVSVFSYVIQCGFIFSTDALMPDISRINPLSGIKRLFSFTALMELIKSMIKLFIVGYVSYRVLAPEAEKISSFIGAPIYHILLYTSKISLKLILYSGIALLALSACDYLFQRYQHEQNLKMTKQEIKEEMKEREGDPKIKARIRSLQRQMAMSRMMQEVPKSDVVITNPIRIAVAIKYNSKDMYAPKVVAKGYGFIAARIKEIARRYGIPVIENKWLARMLIKVEVGAYIPTKLYRAVAEILAYIYQLRGRYHEVA